MMGRAMTATPEPPGAFVYAISSPCSSAPEAAEQLRAWPTWLPF